MRSFPARDTKASRKFLCYADPTWAGVVMQTQAGQITKLLAGWRQGNPSAPDELFHLIGAELHPLARRRLAREWQNGAIQPSSLVQEALLRLLPGVYAGWQNRVHFFTFASPIIQSLRID